ncbi:hypothetical protein [Texcoconibacillus texcoconensis]|nr:hypothetical protein [Texcoconibacillus texcoconensis]
MKGTMLFLSLVLGASVLGYFSNDPMPSANEGQSIDVEEFKIYGVVDDISDEEVKIVDVSEERHEQTLETIAHLNEGDDIYIGIDQIDGSVKEGAHVSAELSTNDGHPEFSVKHLRVLAYH